MTNDFRDLVACSFLHSSLDIVGEVINQHLFECCATLLSTLFMSVFINCTKQRTRRRTREPVNGNENSLFLHGFSQTSPWQISHVSVAFILLMCLVLAIKTADRGRPFSRLLRLQLANNNKSKDTWNSNQNKAAKSVLNIGTFERKETKPQHHMFMSCAIFSKT